MAILSIGELLGIGPDELSGFVPYTAINGSGGVISSINGSGLSGAGTDTTAVSAIASSYAESAASGKLDNSASSLWYPMTGNPSGFLTSVDLSNYATTDYVYSSVSGKADTTSLTAYQTVDGMSAYQPSGDYAFNSSLSAKVDQSAFDDCCSSVQSAISSLTASASALSSDISSLSSDVSSISGALSGKQDGSGMSAYALSSDISGIVSLVESSSATWGDSGCVKHDETATMIGRATLIGYGPIIFGYGQNITASSYAMAHGWDVGVSANSFGQGTYIGAASNSLAQGHYSHAYYDSIAQGNTTHARYESLSQGAACTSYSGSFAQGNLIQASSYSMAQGARNIASSYSFAQGSGNTASGYSFAQGYDNIVTRSSFAHGGNNSGASGSTAFGMTNAVSGASFVVGNENVVYRSIVFGSSNSATGFHVLGSGNSAIGDSWHKKGTIVGYDNTLYGSDGYIFGNNNKLSGNGYVLGRWCQSRYGAYVIGRYNKMYNGSTDESGESAAFVIGDGTASDSSKRHDLLTVTKDGEIRTYSATSDTTGLPIVATLRALSAWATANGWTGV